MRIATKMKLPIRHNGKVTDIKPLELDPKNPGFGKPVEYREIDHKDPEVAQQLRIYRKHGKIQFAELLPCDVAAAEKFLEGNPKATPLEVNAAIKAAQGLQPKPAGRLVAGAKKDGAKKGDRNSKKAIWDARRAGEVKKSPKKSGK
jgi:hypothetical protein